MFLRARIGQRTWKKNAHNVKASSFFRGKSCTEVSWKRQCYEARTKLNSFEAVLCHNAFMGLQTAGFKHVDLVSSLTKTEQMWSLTAVLTFVITWQRQKLVKHKKQWKQATFSIYFTCVINYNEAWIHNIWTAAMQHQSATNLQMDETAVLGSLIEMDERPVGSSTLNALCVIKGSVI